LTARYADTYTVYTYEHSKKLTPEALTSIVQHSDYIFCHQPLSHFYTT